MVKRRIPKKVEKKIADLVNAVRADGTPVLSVYLFGSYAKGKQHKWSDVDVCIISPVFGRRIKDPQHYLWSKRFMLRDYVIEPIGMSPKDFNDDATLGYEIRKTGVKIQ